ncbi:MAG: monovalent cation/H(+) antiporter subunit G [Ilumatobacteraceae bacterium]
MNAVDVAAAGLLIAGTALFVVAAIGLHRFNDLYGRMHAATKPATLGLLLVLTAAALRVDSPGDIGKLALIGVFQLATAPVAAHLLGRSAYRGRVPIDINAGVDDLDALTSDADPE